MNNIINSDAFDGHCQMIIVPISTAATISDSFRFSLSEKMINVAPRKFNYELGEIEVHAIKSRITKYVVFACSVNNQRSSYSAIKLLAEKIGDATKRFPSVKRVGIPLLGTGAGGLDYFESLNTIFNNFYKRNRLNAELIICVPDRKVFEVLKNKLFTEEGVNILRIKELIINNIKSKSKSLDLGNCGIRNFEMLPELAECTHLEELIISNEWGEYFEGHWVEDIARTRV